MRILLLDDDPSCLDACVGELEDSGFEVFAFTSFAAVVAARDLPPPDVTLVDLDLQGESSSDALGWLRSRWPDLPMVALTAHASDDYVFAALRSGAIGYVLKHDLPGCLARVVKDAASGGAPMTSSIARRVLAAFRELSPKGASTPVSAAAKVLVAPKDCPTPREKDVLEALARGLTYQECGTSLGVGVDTIRAHVRNVYRKLHAASKAEAVAVALRHGWLE